jgi:hypothetical protein
MTTWTNLASRRSCTSASLSNKENHPSMTKPPDQPIITTATSVATPSKHTTSISMALGLRKTRKRFFGPPPQERSQRTFDNMSNQYNQKGGVPGQGRGSGRGPFTFKPPYYMYHDNDTIHAQKIARYSSNPRERWSKTLINLCNNHHLEK